jgi:hypothetical protein
MEESLGGLEFSPAEFIKPTNTFGDVRVACSSGQFRSVHTKLIGTLSNESGDGQGVLLSFTHRSSSKILRKEDFGSSPLGCHFHGRIPLLRFHLARGWQVGAEINLRLLMLDPRLYHALKFHIRDGMASSRDCPVGDAVPDGLCSDFGRGACLADLN